MDLWGLCSLKSTSDLCIETIMYRTKSFIKENASDMDKLSRYGNPNTEALPELQKKLRLPS